MANHLAALMQEPELEEEIKFAEEDILAFQIEQATKKLRKH